jgi:hypothetical protein
MLPCNPIEDGIQPGSRQGLSASGMGSFPSSSSKRLQPDIPCVKGRLSQRTNWSPEKQIGVGQRKIKIDRLNIAMDKICFGTEKPS